ncbi:hypothetical protein [Streptomyces sp. NPDC101455]
MTRYRTLKVDDLEIFYREAGPEIHLLDGGHFVLDTCADEAAQRIRAFLT